MQQFYSKNVSVGKQALTHPDFKNIRSQQFSTGLPQLTWYGRGTGWGTDGEQGRNSAHRHPGLSQWPPNDRAPHNSTRARQPLPQEENSRPACARAWASSLGLSSAHRNVPMRPLGIKRKKPCYTEDRSWFLWKWNRRPKPKRWQDQRGAAWRIGSSCRQKERPGPKKWKALYVRLSQQESKESSHDLLKGGVNKNNGIKTSKTNIRIY